MSNEPKGSKPGPITENQLTRVNTIPSVEFTIPSEPLERLVSKCPSHRTRCGDAQGTSKDKNGAQDEESRSVVLDGNEITYPEGGLRAWLVVLGSFSGTVAGFGMMLVCNAMMKLILC